MFLHILTYIDEKHDSFACKRNKGNFTSYKTFVRLANPLLNNFKDTPSFCSNYIVCSLVATYYTQTSSHHLICSELHILVEYGCEVCGLGLCNKIWANSGMVYTWNVDWCDRSENGVGGEQFTETDGQVLAAYVSNCFFLNIKSAVCL